MNFAELLSQDRRLAILRFLSEAPGYELNLFVLKSALDATGHNVSSDTLGGDAAWLAEQGLATQETLAGGTITVLGLTPRGLDVAAGRARHPGVKRPEPGV